MEPTVPTLTYHKIKVGYEVGFNVVSPKNFKEHICELEKQGYKAVTTTAADSPKPLFITFDDAYECIYEYAFPIMSDYKFKGIVFSITDYIGKFNEWDINFGVNHACHLSRKQLLSLSNSGWEIGSHGCHHNAYTGLKTHEIIYDMRKSKSILEDLTGKEVVSFTAPFNAMMPKVYQIANEIGYKNLFIPKSLSRIVQDQSINVIERRMVYGFDRPRNIILKVMDTSKFELIKENVIHFCANATIFVKKFM